MESRGAKFPGKSPSESPSEAPDSIIGNVSGMGKGEGGLKLPAPPRPTFPYQSVLSEDMKRIPTVLKK